MSVVKARVVRDDGKEMTFGGNEWRIPSDGLENWSSLPLDVSSTEIPSYDGAYIVSSRVKSQDRTIKAMARSKNMDELRAAAMSFFIPNHYYDVHLTYKDRTRWARGKLIGFKADEGNIYRPVEVVFTILCPNPYLQSEDNFGKDIAEVMPMFGFPFMSFLPEEDGSIAGFPTGFIMSKYEFSQEVPITNDGDVSSAIKAVIKARGHVVNPRLDIGSGYIKLNTELNENDEITLDASSIPPKVELNGENAMQLVDRKSSILNMRIEVGETTIKYDADSGYQNMIVNVYFNKQYTGV